MHVLAVASSNGLGHFRRTLGLLSELRGRLPFLSVTIVAQSWQRVRAREWDWALPLLGASDFRADLLGSGGGWARPTSPSAQDLFGWEDRLRVFIDGAGPDLVLSDNLAGVLDMRPDTILVGSFLWSDVLEAAHPDSEPVRRFVERERTLLGLHRPVMLCVKPIVMPGVVEQTRAVQVPWMCPPIAPSARTRPRGGPHRVAILGGATGVLDEVLLRIAHELTVAGVDVHVSAQLKAVGGDRAYSYARFSYESREFADLDAVVARPGIGTVTDCVAHGAPLLTVHEDGNIEMRHNAERVSALGIGLDAEASAPGGAVAAFAKLMAAQDAIRARLAAQARNGFERAADWLFTHRLRMPLS